MSDTSLSLNSIITALNKRLQVCQLQHNKRTHWRRFRTHQNDFKSITNGPDQIRSIHAPTGFFNLCATCYDEK